MGRKVGERRKKKSMNLKMKNKCKSFDMKCL